MVGLGDLSDLSNLTESVILSELEQYSSKTHQQGAAY